MERKTFSYWLSQWECWVSKVVKLSSNEWGTKSTLKQKEKIMSPSASCYKKELLFSMKIDDVSWLYTATKMSASVQNFSF